MFGHPLHPMSVHFPLASWILAVPLDLLVRLAVFPEGQQAAAALIAAGCLLALPAMALGLLEFPKTEPEPEVLRALYWHLGLTSAAWALFAAALLVQWTGAGWNFRQGATDLILLLSGLLTLTVGAWRGGDLVYRHRVGVAEIPGPPSPEQE